MPDDKANLPVVRVLIVDDDVIQSVIISGVCAAIGYDARVASSFQVAEEFIRTEPFDCITIDLSLGDRDGIGLLQLIARLDPVPRVVVISGCESRILNATVRMAHAAGIVDAISLPKPIPLGLLREALMSPGRDAHSAHRSIARMRVDITAQDLKRALQGHEIYPAFQPKIELATGRLVGCEALARWDSRDFGQVGPDVFIPLAEQAGCIKAMTWQMMRGSIQMAQAYLGTNPNFVVAVNLSATLLSDGAIPEDVERLLVETGFPARSLMIEVTETVAMADVLQAMDILLRLRIKGVGVSMDDFGTGYSSMSALARMPFCELKIDRSFVTDCLRDADMWKVVASSVAIGHEYNMKVVAEGIEDVDTWNALAGIGCDIGQGYAISRALPQEAFAAWSKGWEPAVERNMAVHR
ncbi:MULTISPECIES: EAL domain-containing response regulator [Rhodopseudomonas]|uniref:Diguanylate phosphodiesterase n=1 Tax=Rhodopseudomonas palustris TaxID=1076 RepID=A0A0D7ELB8_RHOPL|nr:MULTISPECIES: EAL domain-containing response regulator [Rhodopseudomonas]KIZ41634.1 diguanylate phosphodiesterase [Rhodopseudomonas palustris]MDF3809897.1 EAL domain-containing response regulator [Rhodopseudomonas sp. BAL398]WOK17930.1 EAL domain-containing response regulator [Rhodopseudomonas sp. BAL398]